MSEPRQAGEYRKSAVQAVAAVMADLGAVEKGRKSAAAGNYSYRGIDDVINALAGPMRTHGLVIVPHVVEHETVRVGDKGWTETRLTVEYDVCGPDGSTLPRPVRVFAVGLDNGDKGPGKAMSYAYKAAMGQLFCIPTDDPAMDNEATPAPAYTTPPPVVTVEQARQIAAVFEGVEDELARRAVKAKWAKRWHGTPTDLPADDFAEAYANAMDLVEAVIPPDPKDAA